ncbi:MAG: DUF2786 domain-containing protein [Ilumatobacteraceae bacterium]
MGQNSQQRRAAKQRRAARQQRLTGAAGPRSQDPRTVTGEAHHQPQKSPGRPTADRLVMDAVLLTSPKGDPSPGFARALDALIDLETNSEPEHRPTTAITAKLLHQITDLYEQGWQPGDLAHGVKRNGTARGHRLIIAMIANEARSASAATRAPQGWLDQLDDLGAYDPIRSSVIGGHDQPINGWARAERVYVDEKLAIALQVLHAVLRFGKIPLLADPPSRWTDSNRGSLPRPEASSAEVDAKALKLIRALLAKAEATTFEAEAETFTAKAQEMMTRYSIDAAVLAAAHAGDGTGRISGVVSRRVHIDSPYADEKATFLAMIADVNGAKSVWTPNFGFATVTGFPVDLQLTDLLFTSLLVQANHASAAFTSADRQLRTASFRRAFLVSFAQRISERLRTTRRHVATVAAEQYGSSLVPILANRAVAVTAEFERIFPTTTKMKSRSYNSLGWYAGQEAADKADIGHGEAITAG